MATTCTERLAPALAASVSGEDIARGDYVAIMETTLQWPSFLWDGGGVTLSPNELVRTPYIPRDSGQPYKVMAVCLPFVYTTRPCGSTRTIDLRETRIVRLDGDCAELVWKAQRPERRKKK
ncbi:hypothetical protein Pan216_41940 [Planctomycetes bacterium Pan216]|uniref:Uncharacterized protein n=1 Tax=Kolteria novifilia TaxID=2527975 RepID=A0A518B8L1_9BACT|nr:hypothetical protein Pan216_41940 [Planctomycetes bacterium Pan216]